MKRIDDNTIAITNEEAQDLYELLRDFMYNGWDHYTDRVITSTPCEEGMKDLYPSAYNLTEQLSNT